jgi:hypothetical protein
MYICTTRFQALYSFAIYSAPCIPPQTRSSRHPTVQVGPFVRGLASLYLCCFFSCIVCGKGAWVAQSSIRNHHSVYQCALNVFWIRANCKLLFEVQLLLRKFQVTWILLYHTQGKRHRVQCFQFCWQPDSITLICIVVVPTLIHDYWEEKKKPWSENSNISIFNRITWSLVRLSGGPRRKRRKTEVEVKIIYLIRNPAYVHIHGFPPAYVSAISYLHAVEIAAKQRSVYDLKHGAGNYGRTTIRDFWISRPSSPKYLREWKPHSSCPQIHSPVASDLMRVAKNGKCKKNT